MRKKPEVPELNQAKLGFGQIETGVDLILI